MKRTDGFTLIELLVVISIVSLLSSVVLSSLSAARERARIAAGLQFEANILHALGADMLAEYTFESASSLGAETSGGSYSASWNGTAGTQVDGVKSKAIDINFGGGLTASAADMSTNGSFTVSAFIYPRAYTGESGGGGCAHWVYNPTFFGIACNNSLWVNNSSGVRQYFYIPDLKLNKWNHVAISYSGGTARYYLDGKYINSATIGSIPAGASTLYIGGPNSPWLGNGMIDDVRIYGKSIQ